MLLAGWLCLIYAAFAFDSSLAASATTWPLPLTLDLLIAWLVIQTQSGMRVVLIGITGALAACLLGTDCGLGLLIALTSAFCVEKIVPRSRGGQLMRGLACCLLPVLLGLFRGVELALAGNADSLSHPALLKLAQYAAAATLFIATISTLFAICTPDRSRVT